ncbi:MAG: DUF481 domain-containing protein [Bacteroidales bacterium]|nr:DUF481 domain-containing protein [Bacteroidales bacterium]
MKKTIFIFILLIISTSSFSQIVNVEKKRKQKKGFQATIGLNFTVKETGSRILELKNNIDLQYSNKAHNIILLNNIKLLSVDKGSLINNGFQHLRYNYTIKDSSFLTLEVFGQYQYNEQKLLKKRIIAGGGPRFRIVQSEKISWYFAPLAMYEFEQLSDDDNTEIKLFRLDSYTNFRYSISKSVSFNLITYYQPDFGNFNDFRVSGETGIRFHINKYLSYGVNYAFDYDSQPPTDIQNTFWYFKNTLILKL